MEKSKKELIKEVCAVSKINGEWVYDKKKWPGADKFIKEKWTDAYTEDNGKAE